jgi:hypothetical protein
MLRLKEGLHRDRKSRLPRMRVRRQGQISMSGTFPERSSCLSHSQMWSQLWLGVYRGPVTVRHHGEVLLRLGMEREFVDGMPALDWNGGRSGSQVVLHIGGRALCCHRKVGRQSALDELFI